MKQFAPAATYIGRCAECGVLHVEHDANQSDANCECGGEIIDMSNRDVRGNEYVGPVFGEDRDD